MIHVGVILKPLLKELPKSYTFMTENQSRIDILNKLGKVLSSPSSWFSRLSSFFTDICHQLGLAKAYYHEITTLPPFINVFSSIGHSL